MCNYVNGDGICVRQHVTQDHPNWRTILSFQNQPPLISNPKQRGGETLLEQTPTSNDRLDDISDDEELISPPPKTR